MVQPLILLLPVVWQALTSQETTGLAKSSDSCLSMGILNFAGTVGGEEALRAQ